IREGRIKALAVTSPKRGSDLPDTPTMIESGLPGLTTVTYYGFLGPAATPVDVVARINAEVNECLKSAELRANMLRSASSPQVDRRRILRRSSQSNCSTGPRS